MIFYTSPRDPRACERLQQVRMAALDERVQLSSDDSNEIAQFIMLHLGRRDRRSRGVRRAIDSRDYAEALRLIRE